MGWIRRNRSVVWFIIFFLLAGIANLLSRTANPVIDTLMTCIRIRRGEQEKGGVGRTAAADPGRRAFTAGDHQRSAQTGL